MRLRIITLILCLPLLLKGQSPADWWYFGTNAGLHFTGTGPVAINDGQLITSEGCASISDLNGDLLFYTDGSSVYDASHTLMPNGTGLQGNSSSSQSAIVVQKPGSLNNYYIFTVPAQAAAAGLRFSEVDMTLNGGMGDVITSNKNTFLADPVVEKICAIYHSNGTDIWIIAHEHLSNDFLVYEVTSAGVNTTATVSSVGTVHSAFSGNTNAIGYMKASPDGQRVALAISRLSLFEVFDFDPSNGTLSNPITLTGSNWTYGVEFSPNSDLLYAGLFQDTIYQFDLTQTTQTAIQASRLAVGFTSSSEAGSIQTGPDGRLYIAQNPGPFLDVIEFPNITGLGCNYLGDEIALSTGTSSRYGLPTFFTTYFNVAISYEGRCLNDTTYFFLDTLGVDSVSWNFGDPASGLEDTSTAFNPPHLFTDTGEFTVTLIVHPDSGSPDTLTQKIFIYPYPTLDLGNDTILCTGDTLVLDVSQDFASFLWSDSTTADSFIVFQDTTVWCNLFGVCDTLIDTITVSYVPPIIFDLGNDTSFCEGDSLVVGGDLSPADSIHWSTMDSTDFITIMSTGGYSLFASNGCGSLFDSIYVTVIPIPDSALLPPDTINCFDSPITLVHPNLDSVDYFWSDSSSKSTYQVDTTETVWLSASTACGFQSDTIHIIFNGEIQTELGEDTTICDEDSLWLVGVDTNATYLWNTGQTSDSIYTEIGSTQNYVVTITWDACERIEQRYVTSSASACPSIDCIVEMPNVFSPNADGVNDLFRANSNCDISSFDLLIYNRWGQLVHSSRNARYGWDGFINGLPADPGTYFYRLEFRDQVIVDVDRAVFEGSLTLVR